MLQLCYASRLSLLPMCFKSRYHGRVRTFHLFGAPANGSKSTSEALECSSRVYKGGLWFVPLQYTPLWDTRWPGLSFESICQFSSRTYTYAPQLNRNTASPRQAYIKVRCLYCFLWLRVVVPASAVLPLHRCIRNLSQDQVSTGLPLRLFVTHKWMVPYCRTAVHVFGANSPCIPRS